MRYLRVGKWASPLAPGPAPSHCRAMNVTSPLLLLAGCSDASELARACDGAAVPFVAIGTIDTGTDHTRVLPVLQDMQVESINQMVLLMREMHIRAVLDVSHGFDATTSAITYAATRAMGLPYLRLIRPAWDTEGQPRWRSVARVRDAMGMIAPGMRVFSTTGWPSLPEFADFPGDRLLLRQNKRHDRPIPFDFAEPVFGVPPFTKASETQLFEEMGVDLLMARNIGGMRSRPKLEAAIALGLDVILVDRPALPRGATMVDTVEKALTWVQNL